LAMAIVTKPKVIIRADANAAHKYVVTVMDVLADLDLHFSLWEGNVFSLVNGIRRQMKLIEQILGKCLLAISL